MYNGGDTRDRMTNRSTVRTFELFVPRWLDATESLKTKEKGSLSKEKEDRRRNGWKHDRDETIKTNGKGGSLGGIVA